MPFGVSIKNSLRIQLGMKDAYANAIFSMYGADVISAEIYSESIPSGLCNWVRDSTGIAGISLKIIQQYTSHWLVQTTDWSDDVLYRVSQKNCSTFD